MAENGNYYCCYFWLCSYRKLVIATAHMQPSPMSLTLFGRSAFELNRIEYVGVRTGGVQVLVGLPVERAVER